MNDEQLRALLQSGQITPSQYEMITQKIQQMGISSRGTDTPSEREMALDMVMNSPDISGDMKNALGGRGLDTPQERDMLQGLLGGQQQMGQAPVQMPQAPEPTMPMMPMPSASPSKMIMSPMPEISGRGAPTQNETDFLGQFVNNAKNAMGGRPNVDTPQQRDYLQKIMQGYNKGY